MIVRILTEGQFSLPGAHLDELNDIDNRLVDVVEREDRDRVQQAPGGAAERRPR